MRYRIKRTVFDFPWRYAIYNGNVAVSLTFTKWGAERLVSKAKEAEKCII